MEGTLNFNKKGCDFVLNDFQKEVAYYVSLCMFTDFPLTV